MSQMRDGQIHFSKTKSGKNRSVPIAKELVKEMDRFHRDRWGSDHRTVARYFQTADGAFRAGVERAGIELPRGQMSHVLRHTFASHFMMNGGNILTLQRILGHSSLQMTMRYAHLAPEHLQEALALNPLSFVRG
jgi:integrase